MPAVRFRCSPSSPISGLLFHDISSHELNLHPCMPLCQPALEISVIFQGLAHERHTVGPRLFTWPRLSNDKAELPQQPRTQCVSRILT